MNIDGVELVPGVEVEIKSGDDWIPGVVIGIWSGSLKVAVTWKNCHGPTVGEETLGEAVESTYREKWSIPAEFGDDVQFYAKSDWELRNPVASSALIPPKNSDGNPSTGKPGLYEDMQKQARKYSVNPDGGTGTSSGMNWL